MADTNTNIRSTPPVGTPPLSLHDADPSTQQPLSRSSSQKNLGDLVEGRTSTSSGGAHSRPRSVKSLTEIFEAKSKSTSSVADLGSSATEIAAKQTKPHLKLQGHPLASEESGEGSGGREPGEGSGPTDTQLERPIGSEESFTDPLEHQPRESNEIQRHVTPPPLETVTEPVGTQQLQQMDTESTHAAVRASPGWAEWLKGLKNLSGHVGHQLISTGFPPYFDRETVGKLISDGLKDHPEGALALQSAYVVAAVVAEFAVIKRHDRDWQTATKARYGISDAAWDSKTDAERTTLNADRKKAEYLMAIGHVAAVATHLGIAGIGYATGRPELAAAMAATETKSILFSLQRDTIQDTVGVMGTEEPSSGNLNSEDLNWPSFSYGAAQLAGNMLTGQLFAAVPALQGSDWGTHAARTAISSTSNSIIEGIGMAHPAAIAAANDDTHQVFKPSLKMPTGASLMDKSMERWAFFAEFFAPLDLLDVALHKSGLHANAKAAIGAVAAGVVGGLLYKPVTQGFQSSAGVNAAVAERARASASASGGNAV